MKLSIFFEYITSILKFNIISYLFLIKFIFFQINEFDINRRKFKYSSIFWLDLGDNLIILKSKIQLFMSCCIWISWIARILIKHYLLLILLIFDNNLCFRYLIFEMKFENKIKITCSNFLVYLHLTVFLTLANNKLIMLLLLKIQRKRLIIFLNY